MPQELGNTLVMTFVSSFLAYVIGIPLGILLVIWAKDGISPRPKVQEILGVAINLVRYKVLSPSPDNGGLSQFPVHCPEVQ